MAGFTLVASSAAVEAGAGDNATLRRCGPETCVVITGHRADPRASVSVADHLVAARGGQTFRVAIPLESVREWSEPFARTIAVRVEEPSGNASERSVRLPIGLLGQTTELAALEISAP